MTETIDTLAADRALKAKHRAMWALGDYPAVAADVIPELGPVLVAASVSIVSVIVVSSACCCEQRKR